MGGGSDEARVEEAERGDLTDSPGQAKEVGSHPKSHGMKSFQQGAGMTRICFCKSPQAASQRTDREEAMWMGDMGEEGEGQCCLGKAGFHKLLPTTWFIFLQIKFYWSAATHLWIIVCGCLPTRAESGGPTWP